MMSPRNLLAMTVCTIAAIALAPIIPSSQAKTIRIQMAVEGAAPKFKHQAFGSRAIVLGHKNARSPARIKYAQAKLSTEDDTIRILTDDVVKALTPKTEKEQIDATGRIKLQSLTDDVVNAITDLGKGSETKDTDAASLLERSVGNVRVTLNKLIDGAQSEGKTTAYVVELLNEALALRPKQEIPAALTDEHGRIDFKALIRSIVTISDTAKISSVDRGYVASLETEGTGTFVGPGNLSADVIKVEGIRYITVRLGHTLGHLAHSFYGDALLYPRIFAANRDRLNSPDRISVGMRLRIPE